MVAGIGNAYVDELLWEAKVYPLAPGRELKVEQSEALYAAIGKTYAWAIPMAAAEIGEAIEHKVRDFLKVHRKGGAALSALRQQHHGGGAQPAHHQLLPQLPGCGPPHRRQDHCLAFVMRRGVSPQRTQRG